MSSRYQGTRIKPDPDLAAVWAQLTPQEVGHTAMSHKGRTVDIFRPGREGRVRSEWSDNTNVTQYRLENLGWPEWPGCPGNNFSIISRDHR